MRQRELPQPCDAGQSRLPVADAPVKRVLDLALASTLIVVLSPLFVAVATVIALESGWPPLYSQRRTGLDGAEFVMWKFRTMVRNAEALKSQLMELNEAPFPVFKIRNDPRVTRVGRFLRKSSIDELPQLWNVIRGEMSLVGPRPLPVSEAAMVLGAGRRRLAARPGITGIWQISNRHCRSESFDDWVAKDLEYIENWSIWLDLTLLFKTARAVLGMTGQ